jgi:hypothetical protein
MADACSSTKPVPPFEERWRAIAAGIKSRIAKAQPVNYVANHTFYNQADYGRAVIERWMASEEYQARQGKGQGSSN